MQMMINGLFGPIAVQQSAGRGPAVVFVHGNSASAHSFDHQLDSPLGRAHRLIAIDLPGHGASTNATDLSAYTIIGFATALADVVRQLDVPDAMLVGSSLGGHIVLEASAALPKSRGLMIIGTPPLASPPDFDGAFLPGPTRSIAFSAAMDRERAHAFVKGLLRPGTKEISLSLIDDVMRADGRLRAQLSIPSKRRDQVEVVAQLRQPLAVVQGNQDPLINGAYFASLKMPTLWRGEVQWIDDAGHLPHWEQPERFNELLGAFIADCT